MDAQKPKRQKYGGRAPGTPNKATQEFRQTIQALLDENRSNVSKWLALVAKDDPARALDLVSKLAEYAAPKLGRTELTGADGGPIKTHDVSRPKLSKDEWLALHGLKPKDAPHD